jgi:PAS domain S-box-containing protein
VARSLGGQTPAGSDKPEDEEPPRIALIDAEGILVPFSAFTPGASGFTPGAPTGDIYSLGGPGENFLSQCDSAADKGDEDSARLAAGIRSVLRGERESFTLEYASRAATEEHWFCVTVLKSGTEGAVILQQKVTAKKLAEQALREAHDKSLLLLNSIAEGIIGVDAKGACTFVNAAATRMFGYARPEDLLGKRLHHIHHHSYADGRQYPAAECKIYRSLVSGEPVHCSDEVFFSLNGESFAVEYWCYPVRRAGRSNESVLTFLDITERRELEARVMRGQKLEAMGQLTGGVAHDFNNLLTVIMGNSELLVDKLSDDSAQLRRLATLVASAAKRGSDLTKRLLAFGRRQPLDPKPVDLNALVEGMGQLLQRTLGEQIAITTATEPTLWRATVDPGQMESALLNLALNARDAMPAGGKLAIETANATIDEHYADRHSEIAPGEYVRVMVTDSGVGIAAENLGRVFEPFFTTKEKGKGTGLGLAMIYGFVKQSRGHVSIYSERGTGTTVKLYLPRDMTGETYVSEVEAGSEIVGGSELVLVVEDDDMVRSYAAGQLRTMGYQVMEAHDGTEALEIIRRKKGIKLLFTDVVMPGPMNGRQVAEEARKLLPEIRVLFTSGYPEDAIVHHGRLDPGVNLLTKPYSRADLARTMRTVLEGKSPGAEAAS